MKKVLILEDEVNIRSFVVINLKRAGYDAIEAGTGQEALDRLRENPDIGVAILDIGGGTSDIAVLSLNGIVCKTSLKVAGNCFNAAIVKFIRSSYNVLVGDNTADRIVNMMPGMVDKVSGMISDYKAKKTAEEPAL